MKILPFLCLCFLTVCNPPKSSEASSITYKVCDYLWKNQQPDGSWRSKLHGVLKNGFAYTPFVLHSLLQVPESIYPHSTSKIQKALHFIRNHIDSTGVFGKNQWVLEYPNYSTSYALQVLVRWGTAKDKILIEWMKNYLIQQQFDESRDILPTHLAYGGWGFGETNLPKGEVGYMDISHTRRVLEALQTAQSLSPSIKQKTQKFLRITQKHFSEKRPQPNADSNSKIPYDGGFYYSPVVTPRNKGGNILQKNTKNEFETTPFFQSYATATCDGLLSLGLVEDSINIEPILAAKQWLLNHPNLIGVEGIPTETPEGWHLVMFYYHLAVRAEAYSIFKIKENWKEEMVKIFLKEQAKDGSFANPYGMLNKENDPILASALALIALDKIIVKK